MRSAVVVLSLVLLALVAHSQEWSDQAQYDAYMKGDWKQVIELGKLAKQSGIDHYYIRARNGYANFMLGRYMKAEKEFEHALHFNSADAFAKRYGYWSSIYSGNTTSALLKTTDMTVAQKDTFQVARPKWLSSVGVVGGFRVSTLRNSVGHMPYVALYLSHQIGKRVTFRHAVNYLSQKRTARPEQVKYKLWQVGYLASAAVQLSTHTTIIPSVVVLNWGVRDTSVSAVDINGSLSVRQQFGNFSLSVNAGVMLDADRENSDTLKYAVSGSFGWYPLQSTKLYSITSGGYNFGGNAPNWFVSQSIGGQLFKRAWIKSTFIWGHQMMMIEDGNLDFTNNSGDRLRWLWSLSPYYYATDHLGISITYSVESRSFYTPRVSGPGNPRPASTNYNFHSFYIGLNYNF
jgi:hypothetical protein